MTATQHRSTARSAKKSRGAGPRDPERTSAAILAAAVSEFTDKGYAGARIDAIARRSGANKRMIYHYFGDKDGLYRAVLESAYVGIRSSEAGLQLADLAPEKAIERLVAFTWDYFLAHPEFLSILSTENLHRAKFLKKSQRVLELHSPLVSAISDVLKRGAASGTFRTGVDPVHLYISIASLGIFYLSNRWTLSAIFARDLTAQPELRAWGRHISAVILGFLRPEKPLANKAARL
ncbi:MAG: TetR/AcrR family transcriptional regulator [Alphaproteobacteria bacterium]|nr:TetR/AcrR family transcriptional regulator [Alphaproteobacteria bacterium]